MAGKAVRRAERRDVERLMPLMVRYIVDFYRQPRPADEDLRGLIEVCLEGKEGVQFAAEEPGSSWGSPPPTSPGGRWPPLGRQ